MDTGSLADNESNECRNIFHGYQFWVAQRVPCRSSIIGKIESHGGGVTPLEKNANILIADHLRKDVPPGSCSWKFVTDSVEHGIIQLKDRYRIGPDPQTPRPLGSERRLKKKHRTVFTRDDDVALVRWVLSKPHHNGNKIYTEFEQMHPHHTWQSWRSRFTKCLRPLGQAGLNQLAEEPTPESRAPTTGTHVAHIHGSTPEKSAQVISRRRTALPPQNADSAITQMTENRKVVKQSPQPDPSQSAAVKDTQQEGSISTSRHNANTTEYRQNLRRQKFNTDLSIFVEERGIELDKKTRVCGRVVDMWELHQAVIAQNEDASWSNVAEDLGYNGAQLEQAAKLLEDLFLVVEEMCEAVYRFNQHDKVQHQTPEPQGQSLHATASSVPWSRTPPPRSKRPRDEEQQQAESSSKCPRLSCIAETPLTTGTSDRLLLEQNSCLSDMPEELRSTRNQRISTCSHSSRSPALEQDDRYAPTTYAMEIEGRHLPSPRPSSRQSNPEVWTPSQQLLYESRHTETSPHNSTPNLSNGESLPFSAAHPPQHNVILVSGRKSKEKSARRLPPSFPSSTSPSLIRKESSKSPNTLCAKKPGKDEKARLAHSGSQDNMAQIRQVVESYEALRIPRRIVIEALKRTTLTPGSIATLVMENLMLGKSVPENHKGVWTDRDDKGLRFVDVLTAGPFPLDLREKSRAEREHARLVHKHGLDRMQLRRRFLEAEAAFAFD